MKLTKVNEVYKNWDTGDGVFTDLNSFDVPWKDENNVSVLNMTYHGSHSGDKNVAPIVAKFLTLEDTNIRSKLAGIIYNMYADKWQKTWDALQISYNPLNNYDMEEHETSGTTVDNTTTHTGTDTVTMTGTDTNTHTGTDTTLNTGTDTTTHTGTDTTDHDGTNENEISAFNSSTYSDNEKNTIDTTDQTTHNTTDAETLNLSNAETLNLTDLNTRNMTDQTTHNTSEVLDGETETERTLTRSGNIGVTTSQQMLESELRLRKWLYYNEVFNDIDNILTLSIY